MWKVEIIGSVPMKTAAPLYVTNAGINGKNLWELESLKNVLHVKATIFTAS